MVLSQHTLMGIQTYDGDAIGLSQGGAFGEDPDLRRQVQNFAAHDTVGYVLSHMHDTSRQLAREVSVFQASAPVWRIQEPVPGFDRLNGMNAGGLFCLWRKILFEKDADKL